MEVLIGGGGGGGNLEERRENCKELRRKSTSGTDYCKPKKVSLLYFYMPKVNIKESFKLSGARRSGGQTALQSQRLPLLILFTPRLNCC